VTRLLLAVLLAVSTVAGSVNSVSAKPTGPEACTFELDFAAFRQAVGEDIVGYCEANQLADQDGNAHQLTSEGTLSWDAKGNRVTFRDSWRLWMSGPAGIGSDVTIDGLSDRLTIREPVAAPAAAVFDLAGLQPDDLGPAWWYGESPLATPIVAQLGCAPSSEDQTAGSVQAWLYDEERGRTAVHVLSALPGWAGQPMRPQMEQFATACDGWTDRSKRGTYVLHVSLEPFVELGDESMVLRMEIEQQERGERLSRQIGYVRYGGLTSMVAVSQKADESEDDIRSALEWLANRAHSRVQQAAWYLRT